MDERLAEFMGVMLGDGSIGIYSCKFGNKIKIHRVIKVTLDSRNEKYVSYIFNLMKEVLNAKPTLRYKKNENAVDISVFRKEKLDYLLNEIGLVLSPKMNSMKIPEKFLKGKLALSVLRGLFDTDGSVTIYNNNGIIYPRLEIRICPSPCQEQVIKILQENNFRFKVQKLERGHIKIRISGKDELKKWFEKIGTSNEAYLTRAKIFL